MSRASGPRPVAQALSELIVRRGLAREQAGAQLQAAWAEAVGPQFAAQTRVVGLKRGVLEVGVGNAALLSELVSFHNQSLLDTLQTSRPELSVRSLKFRLKSSISQPKRA